MRHFVNMRNLVRLCNVVLILLAVLIAVYGLGRLRSNGPNLYRAVNHKITGLDNSTSSLRYVVFTDPQFGLADIVEKRGEGLDWEQDKKHMVSFARHVNELKPDFVFCTGDLSNAYPESPEWDNVLNGFRSFYRTPQTVDLLDSLSLIDDDIPIMVSAGNHDVAEDPSNLSVGAFEAVWGDTYFYFWSKGHVFITLETQFFRSDKSQDLMTEELKWLEDLFTKLPKDEPKTVMMHVPMFIDNAEEVDSDKAWLQL